MGAYDRYTRIQGHDWISVDNPDDPTDIPIAEADLDKLGAHLVDGRYTGRAYPEHEELAVHVLIQNRVASACDQRDVTHPAHPRAALEARKAQVLARGAQIREENPGYEDQQYS